MSRLLAGLALVVAIAIVADDNPPSDAKQRLSKLQPLVGTWRGVGQPQRGSTKDSWIEEADWAWDFSGKEPALVGKLPNGKYFRQLRLTAGQKEADFSVVATPTADDGVRYGG